MAEPYISYDGTVYTDTDILHPNARACPHSNNHACPTCDHDSYYARKHRAVCPWYETETDHDR